jgi:hypothetical protein
MGGGEKGNDLAGLVCAGVGLCGVTSALPVIRETLRHGYLYKKHPIPSSQNHQLANGFLQMLRKENYW